jgi:uncharacterized protein
MVLVMVSVVLLSTVHGVAKQNLEWALAEAAFQGNVSLVETLLNEGASPDAVDRFGKSALNYAIDEGHLDVAKLLLGKGADVHTWTKDGTTVLMQAAVQGGTGLVKLLLDKGVHATVRIKILREYQGSSRRNHRSTRGCSARSVVRQEKQAIHDVRDIRSEWSL